MDFWLKKITSETGVVLRVVKQWKILMRWQKRNKQGRKETGKIVTKYYTFKKTYNFQDPGEVIKQRWSILASPRLI